MNTMTFTATVINELSKLFQKLEDKNPDTKNNSGRLLARAFLWDQIQSYAKKQSEVAWATLEKEGIVSYVESQGEHVLAESPHFMVMDKVSAPRKAFNAGALATVLKKKYKVPEVTTLEMVEAAKIPGKSVHTTSIVER